MDHRSSSSSQPGHALNSLPYLLFQTLSVLVIDRSSQSPSVDHARWGREVMLLLYLKNNWRKPDNMTFLTRYSFVISSSSITGLLSKQNKQNPRTEQAQEMWHSNNKKNKGLFTTSLCPYNECGKNNRLYP